jgi:hypothetical protein
MKAHKGVEVYRYPFFNFGARLKWMVSTTPRARYLRDRDPLFILEEAGWAPGPIWKGGEQFDATGIRSPDRPARGDRYYTDWDIPAHDITPVYK